MKTIKVSWTQYGKLVDNLAEQIKKSGKVYNGEPCSHKGCASHVSHPCEGCGRQWNNTIKYKAVYSPDNPMLAFLLSKKLEMQLHKHWSSMNSIYKMSFIDKEYLKCMDPETTLVVSDIINTGNTREKYKYFDFACLYYCYFDCNDIFKSPKTFGICEIDKSTKVIMPWEKEIGN